MIALPIKRIETMNDEKVESPVVPSDTLIKSGQEAATELDEAEISEVSAGLKEHVYKEGHG